MPLFMGYPRRDPFVLFCPVQVARRTVVVVSMTDGTASLPSSNGRFLTENPQTVISLIKSVVAVVVGQGFFEF